MIRGFKVGNAAPLGIALHSQDKGPAGRRRYSSVRLEQKAQSQGKQSSLCGGARAGWRLLAFGARPKQLSIARMTSGSVMAEMIVRLPPHLSHLSTSIAKTRRNSSAH